MHPERATIGDVIVCASTEPSPYRVGLLGEARYKALVQFYRTGQPPEGLALWYAPMKGGARRITARDEIAWETSRIPQDEG